MQKILDEAAAVPRPRNPGSNWDDNEPVDQTPPPDHEDFERLSAPGLRAMKERRAHRPGQARRQGNSKV